MGDYDDLVAALSPVTAALTKLGVGQDQELLIESIAERAVRADEIMNVTLSLSPEETAELQRRASASGTDIKTFLLHVIHYTNHSLEQSVADIPYEEWKQEFQSWVRRSVSRNPNMDDSRESIYD